MSSIKLKHSGGNSVIIAAPSSNPASDRTLTLPSDADGTIVSKDASNNVAEVASINGNSIGTKNLVTNGAFTVAQRGADSTSSGYQTVDTWSLNHSVQDAPYQMQVAVASGTTPYNLGFRKAFQVMNGNQSNGATASSILYIRQKIESQNIAQSGWNYTDPNSKITLSFWIKSSVAQSFHGHVRTVDGTAQRYPFQTGALTANTWTKITKVIPGNSNLQFDTDTTANAVDRGLDVVICAYMGTTYSDSSATFDQWQGEAAANFAGQDMTTTWFTTNDATLDITGVQLEVGSTASSYAHESYAETLAKCQRYLFKLEVGVEGVMNNFIVMSRYSTGSASNPYGQVHFPVEMRDKPTFTYTGGGLASAGYAGNPSLYHSSKGMATLKGSSTVAAGGVLYLRRGSTGDLDLFFSAEL